MGRRLRCTRLCFSRRCDRSHGNSNFALRDSLLIKPVEFLRLRLHVSCTLVNLRHALLLGLLLVLLLLVPSPFDRSLILTRLAPAYRRREPRRRVLFVCQDIRSTLVGLFVSR